MPILYKFTSSSNSSVIKRELTKNCKFIDYSEVKVIEEKGKAPYFAVVGFKEVEGWHHYVVIVPLRKDTYFWENELGIEQISQVDYNLFLPIASEPKYKDSWTLVSTSLVDFLIESLKTVKGRNHLRMILAVTIAILGFTVMVAFTFYQSLNH